MRFFFCLRISEILALSRNDILLVPDFDGLVLSILIRSSKTDQEKNGATRMLRATGSDLCPVQATQRFLTLLPANSGDASLFPKVFRARLAETMKWAATRNNIPSAVVNTHSLRAGCATALFSAGVDWVTIQRWGDGSRSCFMPIFGMIILAS